MKRGERKLWREIATYANAVAESKNYAEEYIAKCNYKNANRKCSMLINSSYSKKVGD